MKITMNVANVAYNVMYTFISMEECKYQEFIQSNSHLT